MRPSFRKGATRMGGSPSDGTYLDRAPGASLQSGRACETVRSGFRLLAQTVQLPDHDARQTAPLHDSRIRYRYVCCVPRLRPRVPVRLVADEDARVQAPQWVGCKGLHHRSRSQGGLISGWPAVGIREDPTTFASGPAKNLLFPGTDLILLNSHSLAGGIQNGHSSPQSSAWGGGARLLASPSGCLLYTSDAADEEDS